MTITIIIIVITAIISIMSFNNRALMDKLQFNPYRTYHQKQWFRLITHAFVHADYIHLFVNMIVLLSFGIAVEKMFDELKTLDIISNATIHFLTLYFGGIVISSLTTLKKHKDNYYYNSVGASGAVSAIVFTSIFFQPLSKLYIMGIIPMPAIIFGVAYLIYSHYMSRKSSDNINHDAHFLGAVFGFVYPLLINPKLFNIFLNQLGL